MQKRITKDLLTYLPAQALPALASFITAPIFTRLFSPDEYGNLALASAVAEFLLLGTVVGLGQGAVRFFSAYRLKSSLSSYFAAVFGSVGLITMAAVGASAGILVIFHSLIPSDLYPLLWAAVVLYVVNSFNSTLMDVLRGQEKSRWYSVVWISQSYGGVIFGLILVLVFGMGIGGLIWGQTLAVLLSIIPLVWLTTRSVRIRPSHLNRSDLKQLWAFALPFTIGNLGYWTLNLSDRYVVEMLRGSYEVGVYSVANKISSRTIQLFVNLFFLVPGPILCRLWEERGRQATEEALTSFTRLFLLIMIPAVSGLAVVAAPVMQLLVDEKYYTGYPAIWLVAVGSMGLGLTDLAITGCIVTNRTRLIAMNQFAAAAFNLITTIILVQAFGFMGAAVSTALSFLLLAVLQAITSARFLTWRWPLRSLWRVLAASAAMCASVLLVQAGLRSDTTVWLATNLLLSITAGALTYGALLWFLGEITPQQLLSLLSRDRSPAATSPIVGE